MIVRPSERREAERFAQLLEDLDEPGRATDPQLAPLVGLASRLTALDTASVDPAFRARLRQRLLTKAAWQGVGEGEADSGGRRRRTGAGVRLRRRLVALAAAAAAVAAISGLGGFSDRSNPGDTLYAVKRAKEDAQLALTPSEVNKGVRELQYAAKRLSEADAVVRDDQSVGSLLTEMDAFTESGARRLNTAAVDRQQTAPLDAVDSFVEGQRTRLEDLSTQLPDSERDRVLDSMALLDRIDMRSEGLRATAECSDGEPGEGDEIGPYPEKCSAASRPGGSDPSAPGGGTANPSSGQGNQPGEPGTNPGTGPGSGPGGTDPGSGEGEDPGTQPGDPTEPLPDQPTEPVDDAVSGTLEGVGEVVGGLTDGLLG